MKRTEAVTLSSEVQRLTRTFRPGFSSMQPEIEASLRNYLEAEQSGERNLTSMQNIGYTESTLALKEGVDKVLACNALTQQIASCVVVKCHLLSLPLTPESIAKALLTEDEKDIREMLTDNDALRSVEASVQKAADAEKLVTQLRAEKLALENQILELQEVNEKLQTENAALKTAAALSDSKAQSVVVPTPVTTTVEHLVSQVTNAFESIVGKWRREQVEEFKARHERGESVMRMFDKVVETPQIIALMREDRLTKEAIISRVAEVAG